MTFIPKGYLLAKVYSRKWKCLPKWLRLGQWSTSLKVHEANIGKKKTPYNLCLSHGFLKTKEFPFLWLLHRHFTSSSQSASSSFKPFMSSELVIYIKSHLNYRKQAEIDCV